MIDGETWNRIKEPQSEAWSAMIRELEARGDTINRLAKEIEKAYREAWFRGYSAAGDECDDTDKREAADFLNSRAKRVAEGIE